jgi:hypothetical protein
MILFPRGLAMAVGGRHEKFQVYNKLPPAVALAPGVCCPTKR